MKKRSILSLFFVIILSLNGCYKKVDTPQGADNTIILAYPSGLAINTLNSGLDYFDNALLNFSLRDATDTLLISANLINRNSEGAISDINVSIKEDSDLVNDYNNNTSLQSDTTHEILALMPPSYYSIIDSTATIKAGSSQTTFRVVFYPSQFDITQTGYLLPITIKNASAGKVNSNLNTVYFHIYKDPYPPYDRTGWKIIGFDSQEAIGEGPNNGAAIYCIDGNTGTYWHTQWDTDNVPGYPHWIKIDMGKNQSLHGIYYLPRQALLGDGWKDITVLAGEDTTNWQTVGNFTLTESLNKQKIALSGAVDDVRYLEVIINDNYDGKPWTNCAELWAY